MDTSHDPSRDSMALARQHVRALTDGGVSREALLRALLEQDTTIGSNLPQLPSQAIPNAPLPPLPIPKSKSKSLSRTMSMAQMKSKSNWSVSAKGRAHEEGDRPASSDRLSTATSQSGSRGSYVSTQTTATSVSSRSSTVTQFPAPEVPGARPTSGSTRAYWCTSCDTEFKRKFDWKRHEDEFHERYKKYPCPDCNRVFWGANTFNQHHKSRHNCKTCPHADKVIKYSRKKRAWACGFCAAFLPSMDRYIDHIGLHYESGRTRAHWYHSNVIYGLLHQPGVNAAWRSIIGSRFSHIPKDQQPRYGWDPKTTGRKQGFLENETAGNLQDLLEFFNPTKDDAMKIAKLAFDFAELTPASQSPGRSSLDVPDKEVPPPPPPPGPKREKSSSSSGSRKKISSSSQRQFMHQALSLAPAAKERPMTQWPSGAFAPPDVPELPRSEAGPVPVPMPVPVPAPVSMAVPVPEAVQHKPDVPMADYDIVPQPLFANTISPPPQQAHFHQLPPPELTISPSSDHPTFLAPPTPTTPFPGSNMPRDTVLDLVSDYMDPDQLSINEAAHMSQGLSSHPPFGSYEDWNSMCSTTVEDVASPRQAAVRRSDFWAPPGDGPESMYMDGMQASDAQACDLSSLPPPQPSLHEQQEAARRSDVWVSSASVDYEGMGYDEEIAPPPPHANWL